MASGMSVGVDAILSNTTMPLNKTKASGGGGGGGGRVCGEGASGQGRDGGAIDCHWQHRDACSDEPSTDAPSMQIICTLGPACRE